MKGYAPLGAGVVLFHDRAEFSITISSRAEGISGYVTPSKEDKVGAEDHVMFSNHYVPGMMMSSNLPKRLVPRLSGELIWTAMN